MAAAEVELPKQYKACVYDAPGKISTKVETLDMPEPGPGEVLIHLYDHGSIYGPQVQWRPTADNHVT